MSIPYPTKTRDEILAPLRDELRGLLMESFARASKVTDFSNDGRMMVQQLRRAQDLFDRIVSASSQPNAENGKPAAPSTVKART